MIILTISADKTEKLVSGEIIAESENETESIEVLLNFVKDFVPENSSNNLKNSCVSDLSGAICNDKQKCEGDTTYAQDGKCCLGTCINKPKSSTGKIIGWVLIIAVILFLIWFFISKYKRARGFPSMLERIKGN